jgi:hypothetical protein
MSCIFSLLPCFVFGLFRLYELHIDPSPPRPFSRAHSLHITLDSVFSTDRVAFIPADFSQESSTNSVHVTYVAPPPHRSHASQQIAHALRAGPRPAHGPAPATRKGRPAPNAQPAAFRYSAAWSLRASSLNGHRIRLVGGVLTAPFGGLIALPVSKHRSCIARRPGLAPSDLARGLCDLWRRQRAQVGKLDRV